MKGDRREGGSWLCVFGLVSDIVLVLPSPSSLPILPPSCPPSLL
jgi:hypothetical protein